MNEIQASKTKALLKSINLLKKEIQKIKYEQKDNVRHQKNLRLEEDLKLQEVAINALRKVVGDEDKCNMSIKKELEKGPARIRVLSREELKIEIKKYKNISLKIIKDFQKAGGKVPGYAGNLMKEAEGPQIGEGLKKEKSEAGSKENYEGESMFDAQSEMVTEGEIPEKAQNKIDKLEEQVVKLKIDLKDKNEKLLELFSELEDIKIQVFARDKSIEL